LDKLKFKVKNVFNYIESKHNAIFYFSSDLIMSHCIQLTN